MSAPAPAAVVEPDVFDFYNVRSLLTEDERQIQDAVARFVDEKVIPIIGDAFDAHRFPKELVPEIAALGLLGCNIDGYDCAGLNHGPRHRPGRRGAAARDSISGVLS